VSNLLQKQSNGTSSQRIDLIKTLLIAFSLQKKKSDKTIGDKKTKLAVKSDTEINNFMPSIKVLLRENNVHNFLRVNEFEGTTYFNKERFEEFFKWILLFQLNGISSRINDRKLEGGKLKKTDFEKEIVKISKENFERFIELLNKAESCSYDFIKFQEELNKENVKKVNTKPINKKRKKV
jgi:hypothetical protein